MKYHRICAAAGALTLAVLGAACSSDQVADNTVSSTPTTSAATTPTTAPAVSTTTVARGGSTTTSAAAVDSTPTTEPGQPQPGTLTFADENIDLTITRCVKAANGTISVRGNGTTGSPLPTLIANLTDPVSGSTMVYTTVADDNSYVTYSMASATGDEVNEGALDDTHVTLSGKAVKQGYDPKGAPVGEPVTDTLALDGTCPNIADPTPAAPAVPAASTTTAESTPPTT